MRKVSVQSKSCEFMEDMQKQSSVHTYEKLGFPLKVTQNSFQHLDLMGHYNHSIT